MKVIHYIASIDKSAGGTTAYMQLLSKELKNQIELIVATGVSPQPVLLEDVNVKFFDTSLSRWFFLKKEFYTFLKAEKADIVHINGIWNPENSLFQKVAQSLSIKVVLSPHGMLEPYILNRHPLKKKIALALYQDKAVRKTEYIHATASSESENIRHIGYQQTATIVPNGIEISEVKEKIEFGPKENFNVLFLSRVHPKKGLELLLEALAKLKTEKLKVNIAGEGDTEYVQSLKIIAEKLDVSHQVDFLGGIYGNRKWELYQESDLFVLPTYSENFGIVVPEALATGIPVITTTGTPWEELNTHKCGWWIDLSVENLVKSLQDAMSKSPKELEQMGQRGKRLVIEKYDIKSVAGKMKEFYASIINNEI